MRNSDLTPRQRAELEELADMSDESIDFSDIPEITDFSNPRRGMFARSPNTRAVPKATGGVDPEPGNAPSRTDTSESGLETRVISLLVMDTDTPTLGETAGRPSPYSNRWTVGDDDDYRRRVVEALRQDSNEEETL